MEPEPMNHSSSSTTTTPTAPSEAAPPAIDEFAAERAQGPASYTVFFGRVGMDYIIDAAAAEQILEQKRQLGHSPTHERYAAAAREKQKAWAPATDGTPTEEV